MSSDNPSNVAPKVPRPRVVPPMAKPLLEIHWRGNSTIRETRGCADAFKNLQQRCIPKAHQQVEIISVYVLNLRSHAPLPLHDYTRYTTTDGASIQPNRNGS